MNLRITTMKQTGVFCETCARNLLGNELIEAALRSKRAQFDPMLTKVEATAEQRACRFHNFRLGK